MKSLGNVGLLPPRERRTARFWPMLLAGLATATIVPIGLHTLMLDVLGIPYPDGLPRSGWTTIPDHALLIVGALHLEEAFRARLRLSIAQRFWTIFICVAAINQSLLRLPLMRNAVSTEWTIYPFIDNLPEVLRFAVMAGLVVACGIKARGLSKKIAVAVVIAGLLDQVLAPAFERFFASTITANAGREGEQLYSIPYDWHVNLPSYLTFLEPAGAALLVAFQLRRSGVRTAACASILFASQAGPMFRLAAITAYSDQPVLTAIASEAQFTLEALALGLVAAVIPGLVTKPSTYLGASIDTTHPTPLDRRTQ